MKRIIILVILLSYPAFALSVENIIITPNEAWMGDSLNVTASCVNNQTPISRVYADITGPGIILPSLDLTHTTGNYFLSVPGNYFDRKGSYSTTVFCIANNTANISSSFSISEFTSSIEIQGGTYEGNLIEVNYVPKKNDFPITSGISFEVFLDAQKQLLALPPIYDTIKGWVLRINSPAAGSYAISVQSNYQGKIFSTSSHIEVKKPLDFSVVNVDKKTVRSGENVTVNIRAMERGSPIQINESSISISAGGSPAVVRSISKSGDNYLVKFTAPELNPGKYDFAISINHNGVNTLSGALSYTTTISGSFSENGQLRFSRNGAEIVTVNSISDGSYSGEIVPDTYDVRAEFSRAKITLNDAAVNSFTNAFKYAYIPGTIDGFLTSGIYEIKTSWSFGVATVELEYDETLYANEDDVKIFRCADWNGKCNGSWSEINADVGKDTNRARFSVSGFSAFIVGLKENIKISLNINKEKYSKKDLIELKGSVYTNSKQLDNSTVRILIDGTYVDHTIKSDRNGIFDLDFVGPEDEGNYTLTVSADRSPYIKYETTRNIEVVSKPSLSIIFPGSVQIEQGGNKSDGIRIVNTGQSSINNIGIKIDMDELHEIGAYPDYIGVGEEIIVPVMFFANGAAKTVSAKIQITSDEISQEKIFGFTVLENTPEKITGATVTSAAEFDIVYIAIFATTAFFFAFLVKKRKKIYSFDHYTENTADFHSGRVHKGITSGEIPARRENDPVSYLSGVKIHISRKRPGDGIY